MAAIVSMLRGVNVGGHNKIAMDALRAVYESLGLRKPRTYIQSGNVVFETGKSDPIVLAGKIEHAIEQRFGFRPAAILRTRADLEKVIEANPFADKPGVQPNRLLVTFLGDHPSAPCRQALQDLKTGPDELRIAGREVYIHYPDGMGRSKLSGAVIERILKVPGTARNWNSVLKLFEIACEIEGAK